MPSTSLSPHIAPMPTSPRNSGPGAAPPRPPLMKRQSSQSSHSSRQQSHPVSPGSVGEHPAPAPRHHVKPRHTKIVLPRNHSSGRNLAKLARQAQQQPQPGSEDTRRHSRQRSHEGAAAESSQAQSDFRLPGSLGDDEGPTPTNAAIRPAPMRRNLTSSQLPRNTSHTKLKKNLSHGALSRLHSGRNLAAMSTAMATHHQHHPHHRGPPSPGLKGRSKRPKSMDITGLQKDLHEQEVELLIAQKQQQQQQQQQQQPQRQRPRSQVLQTPQHERRDSRKRVGFAVGSAGDGSDDDDDDVPDMEGSGLQEDEWTDQSASASPYSTRQNTANNSRRASVVEKHPLGNAEWPSHNPTKKAQKYEDDDDEDEDEEDDDSEEEDDDDDDDDEDDDDEDEDEDSDDDDDHTDKEKNDVAGNTIESGSDEAPSPHSSGPVRKKTQQDVPVPLDPPAALQEKASNRGSVGEARDHMNPTTRRLLSRSQQLPAPALVSNISALDATHSIRGSPAVSLRSSRSNLADSTGDPEQDELVSCFVPSTSHPSLGSGTSTMLNTPRQGGFHAPDGESGLGAQRRDHATANFQVGPISPPGSTLSASSGAATPALGRSRTELRMMQEKALADIESSAERQPTIPAHFYDRRNESLKPYLKGNMPDRDASRGAVTSARFSMGPEIFQGRFRAVNTELRVVQKFRDPVGEAIARLRACKSIKTVGKASAGQQQSALLPSSSSSSSATGLTMSKSTTSLPARQATGGAESSKAAPSPLPPNPGAATGATLARGTAGAQSAVQLNRSLQRAGSERQKTRREVSFARVSPEVNGTELSADAIARQLWMEI